MIYKRHRKEFWWTAQEVAEIGRLYEQGLSMAEIGKKYKISRQRINQLFEKYGVATRPQTVSKTFLERINPRKKNIPKDILVKLYVNECLMIKDIAEQLKINPATIYQHLKIHGIPKRGSENYKSKFTFELLHKLYIEENMTAVSIAERFGVKPVTISTRLWKLGIKKYKQ